MWVEENRFKKVPVDRSVAAEEVEPVEPAESAPRDVGPAGATAPDGAHPRRGRPPVPGEGGTVGGPQNRTAPARPTRMNRGGARPTPVPAPPQEVVPPPEEAAPAQPEPGQDQPNPETMPEQPQPPEEVEPS
jgi:hypothetical protein